MNLYVLRARRVALFTVLVVAFLQMTLASASTVKTAPYDKGTTSTAGSASAVANKTTGEVQVTATATGGNPIAFPDSFGFFEDASAANATITQSIHVDAAGTYSISALLDQFTFSTSAAKGGQWIANPMGGPGVAFDYAYAKASVSFRYTFLPEVVGGTSSSGVINANASSATGGQLTLTHPSVTVNSIGRFKLEVTITSEVSADGESDTTHAESTIRAILANLTVT